MNKDRFVKYIPKDCVMEAIEITGYNLKYVYNYLKKQGCVLVPDENQAAGQIWVFDPDCKECIAYTPEEFHRIFELRHKG